MTQHPYFWVLIVTIGLASCARTPDDRINLAPDIDDVHIVGDRNPSSELRFRVEVSDPEADSMLATWSISHGQFLTRSLDSARWISPDSSAYVRLIYMVEDAVGNISADTSRFWIDNQPPVILNSLSSDSTVLNGNTITLTSLALDPDSHAVSLSWSSPWGLFTDASGPTARWTVPDSTMHAWAVVRAEDPYGAWAADTVKIKVYTEVGCAWILNQGRQEIVKLSAIGDELLRLGGFTDLRDLDVDPGNRRLWVSEGNPPAVHALDFDGNPLHSITEGLARPDRIRAWHRTGSILVMDTENAAILEFNLFGDNLLRSISGLHRPNALDINQRTGELWICDEGSNYLYHVHDGYEGDIAQVDSSLHIRKRDGYLYPVDVSVEDSTGACWLVDKEAGMLVRYEPNGLDSLIVTGFDNPVAISAAWSEGLCWVMDRGLNSSVSRYFFDLRQVQVDGLLFPKDLAYNRLDEHLWVLDSERNRVLRIDPEGQRVGSWTDFDFPTRIVINGGY